MLPDRVSNPGFPDLRVRESYVKTMESYEVCRLGHHMDNKFPGKDQNGPNNRIGPDCVGRAQLESLFVFTFQTIRLRPGKKQTYFIHK